MTVSELSVLMRSQLVPHFGADEARSLERAIFEDLMNLSLVDVAMSPDRQLPDFMPGKVQNVIERLLKGEPLQYITGTARFCGMTFHVTPAVLIPRPETEQLVDMIVDGWESKADLRVLDLGTGSGCIAIALARALKFAHVTAADISTAALEVAKRNADDLHARVKFVQADILNLKLPGEWDIIVSNPPYVLEKERASMEPNVLEHEPAGALFVPDDDPMKFYDAILSYSRSHLAPGGAIYFEINPLCADRYKGAKIIRDYRGVNRFATYET